jgi:hypothetical protein
MKSKTVLSMLVCLILVAISVAFWKMAPFRTEEPVEPGAPDRLIPPASLASSAKPAPVVFGPQTTPELGTDTPTATDPPEDIVQPESLTAETLAGTTWEDGLVIVNFLPDGRWEMNGRICAKWEVEGSRVRIYDDKGEEHFVDIVANKLAFERKTIARRED